MFARKIANVIIRQTKKLIIHFLGNFISIIKVFLIIISIFYYHLNFRFINVEWKNKKFTLILDDETISDKNQVLNNILNILLDHKMKPFNFNIVLNENNCETIKLN